MPDNPLRELADRLQRMREMALATAVDISVELQGEMRANASWRDRFGHARNGLQARALPGQSGSLLVTIICSHSVDYGVYLENPRKAYTVRPVRAKALKIPGIGYRKSAHIPARGNIYAVIRPTIERNLDRIGDEFRRSLLP